MNAKTLETLTKLSKHASHNGTDKDEVKLAGIVYTKEGEIWDPILHPRNQKGHFVKKGFGLFLFGHNKKAKFTSPGKVEIDYELEPGDIAVKTPVGNLYVRHPDGSWTTYPSKTKYQPTTTAAKYADKYFNNKTWVQVDSAPAVEVPGNDEAQAKKGLTSAKVGDPVTAQQMAFLPAGSQTQAVSGDTLTKNGDGHWVSAGGVDAGVWAAADLKLLKVGGKKETAAPDAPDQEKKPLSKKPLVTSSKDAPETPAVSIWGKAKSQDTPMPKTYTDAEFNTAVADRLPEGTKVVYEDSEYGLGAEYTKGENGLWKSTHAKDFTVTSADLVADSDGSEGIWQINPTDGEKSEDEPTEKEIEEADKYVEAVETQPEPMEDWEKQLLDDPWATPPPGTVDPAPVQTGLDDADSPAAHPHSYTGVDPWLDPWANPTEDPWKKAPDTTPPPAPSAAAARKVDSAQGLDAFPVGTVVRQEDLDKSWTKQDSGKWLDNGPNGITDTSLSLLDFLDDGEFFQVQQPKDEDKPDPFDFNDVVDEPTPPLKEQSKKLFDETMDLLKKQFGESTKKDEPKGLQVGDKPQTQEELDALPVGTVIESQMGSKLKKTGPKVWWHEKAGYEVNPPTGLKITELGEKPEFTPIKAEPVSVPGKKNKLTAANPLDAPEPNGELTSVAGKDAISQLISPEGFTHPVSKTVFPLEKGDQVLQHKITSESFAILDSQGNKKFQVNKHGKKYKWSPHIPKSNYKTIYTTELNSETFDPAAEALPDVNDFLKGNTFTHPASGLKVTIGENEKLLQHNFTAHSYLVVNDQGDMLYKIDVKGKKQKAGTNLKPSNYHEVFDGAPKSEQVKFKVTDKDLSTLNLAEFDEAMTAAKPGDYLNVPVGGGAFELVSKQSDGTWASDDILGDGLETHNIKQLYVAYSTTDAKSDSGVPIGPKEFRQWLKGQPDGTVVTVPSDFATKQLVYSKLDGEYTLSEVDETGATTKINTVPELGLGVFEIHFSHHSSDAKKKTSSVVIAPPKEEPKKSAPKETAKDVPAGKVGKLFGDEDAVEAYIKTSSWHTNNEGIFADIAKAMHVTMEGHQYSLLPGYYNLPDGQTAMGFLGSDEMLDAVSNGIATLENAKKDKTLGLPTAQKSKITKMVSRLKELQGMVLAAKEYNAGGNPDYVVNHGFIWGKKVTWDFDMKYLQNHLTKALGERKFAVESESDFGGDPFNATKEEYQQYLEKQGDDWAAFLDVDAMKKYALHKLGAPNKQLNSWAVEAYKKQAIKGQLLSKVSDAVAAKNGDPWTPANSVNPAPFPDDPPPNTSQTLWNAVQQALSTESVVDVGDKDTLLSPQIQAIYGPMAETIPPEAQKVLAKLNENYDELDLPAVVGHLVKSGIWNESALTFDAPEGQFPLTPGMEVYQSNLGYLFVPKGWEDLAGTMKVPLYKTADSQFMGLQVFGIKGALADANQGWGKVYKAPYFVTKADAKKAGLTFADSLWEQLENNEGSIPPKESFSGQELVDLNKILQGHPVKVSEVSNKAKTLLQEMPDAADLIIFKDQQGQYRTPTASETGDGLPEDPIGAIKAGLWNGVPQWMGYLAIKTEENPTAENLANEMVDWYDSEYASDPSVLKDHAFDILPEGTIEWDAMQWLSNADVALKVGEYMMSLITPPGSTEQKKTSKPTAVKTGINGDLIQIPYLNLGGGRPKAFYTDADGIRYMVKPDPFDPFRPDTEHAAMEVARLFMPNTPQSSVRDIDGEYSHVQSMIDASTDFTGKSYSDLTEDQLVEAMSSHTIDWAISNHDTHAGQFLLTKDGDVVKIDLGQAWKALGSDKLEVGYYLKGNFGANWYEDFYKSVQAGKVDKETLDKVAKAALKRAYAISNRHDDTWRENLEFAFKNRPYYPPGMTRETFTDLAMQRKQDTFDDFLKFYEDLYSDGGYDFPFEDASFRTSKTETDAHLDLSEEFASEVKQNKAYGKSLFFSSNQIEDAHAFFYTTQSAKKTDTLRGELKLRGQADSDVESWLKAQKPKTSTATTPTYGGTLTYTTNAQNALVAFAKTVSVHAADGKYTQSTVNTATEQMNDLKLTQAAILNSLSKDPMFVQKGGGAGVPTFQSPHEQQAWLRWSGEMIGHFEKVTEAMNSYTAAPQVPSTAPKYDPPKGIDLQGKPKVVETITGPDGSTLSKYSNWGFTDSSDKAVTEDLYESTKKSSGWTAQKPDTQESVTNHTGKKYEVVATGFSTPHTSGADAEGNSTDQLSTAAYGSNSYEITSPDHPGVRLHYTPHSATDNGSNFTNAGRLQVEVRDWDGSTDQMDKAMELVRDMGVDLSPADETSLERTYWEQMAGVLGSRKLKAKWTKVRDAINQLDPNVPDDTRIVQLREAFAGGWGKETVDNADWTPKFSEHRNHLSSNDSTLSGRPYWMRPDFDVETAKDANGGFTPSRTDGSSIYLTAGVYSANEEKIRFTGLWGKDSNSPDSDRDGGSGQFAFFRQGVEQGYSGIYAEPHVLARTTNYAFAEDSYGRASKRAGNAPFDLEDSYNQGSGGGGGYQNSSNELMVKYSASLFDDIAVVKTGDEGTRQQLIKFFKDRGVNEIRGLPIEERIVHGKEQVRKTLDKVWDFAKISQELQKKNRGAAIGTVKTWEGKQYIKRANGQWVPVGTTEVKKSG